ncbi:MAG: ATP-binding cassette domain-containing protein [Bacillota bacterium]
MRDVSFSLRRGEILGISGLVGAGRTELARAIFGRDRIDGGTIYMHGVPITPRSPHDAVRRKIGLLTEDRKAQGLVLRLPVDENTTLAGPSRVIHRGFIDVRRERELAGKLVSTLSIRTPGLRQQVMNLSGGNQQKVVLAKWLFTDAEVLIFDEPTRGIDVGAKAEIYQLMRDLAARGVGIIMISSELQEILGMSDRILVMREGSIVAEFGRDEATQEGILAAAMSGSRKEGEPA